MGDEAVPLLKHVPASIFKNKELVLDFDMRVCQSALYAASKTEKQLWSNQHKGICGYLYVCMLNT